MDFCKSVFLSIPVHHSRANHADFERKGEQMADKSKNDANKISLTPNLGKHGSRFMTVGYLFAILNLQCYVIDEYIEFITLSSQIFENVTQKFEIRFWWNKIFDFITRYRERLIIYFSYISYDDISHNKSWDSFQKYIVENLGEIWHSKLFPVS